MRKRSIAVAVAATFALAGGAAAVAAAPAQASAAPVVQHEGGGQGSVKADPGEVHYVFDIQKATLKKRNVRTAAWTADAGDAILVPSGTWHNIVNTGRAPLKLYSLYGPQQHPKGTIHETQADDDH